MRSPADRCGPDERIVIQVFGSVHERRGTCDRHVFPFRIDDAVKSELGQLAENYLTHRPRYSRMPNIFASLASLCPIQDNETLACAVGKEVEGLKAELTAAQAALAAAQAEHAALDEKLTSTAGDVGKEDEGLKAELAASQAALAAKTMEHAALLGAHVMLCTLLPFVFCIATLKSLYM